MTPLRLATRGSALALWQARHVAGLLRPAAAPRPVELVLVTTTGDVVQDKPLSQIGGDGLFTKEVQEAVLAGRADVAVHSLKDLPTIPVPGLTLGAAPERGPTGDAFVSVGHRSFAELPHGAVVATSSLRRRAQLLNRRPDLRPVDLRGNVETRLRKLDEGQFDAIVLAEAGLVRLGLAARITELLDPAWMQPAVGQGALGLECRADDAETRRLLALLDHAPTRAAVTAERAMLAALGGGCLVPVGAVTRVAGGGLTIAGSVVATDGSTRVSGERAGAADDAAAVGAELGRWLGHEGGADIVRAIERGRLGRPGAG